MKLKNATPAGNAWSIFLRSMAGHRMQKFWRSQSIPKFSELDPALQQNIRSAFFTALKSFESEIQP